MKASVAAIATATMTRVHANSSTSPGPAIDETRSIGSSHSSHQPLPSIRFIPHHDPRAPRPSLSFASISRTLPTHTSVIRVGRYSERDGVTDHMHNTPSASPVGFKSKVVSRRHCEFWCEDGQWYIKDVKSSSGTFLNHLRLSPPNVESRPWKINDGDVVQLGIDFRGGEEAVFRCVKIRVEVNRSWQKQLNNFNKTTHRRLQNLGKIDPTASTSLATSDCSICLLRIAPCQSLFVAPCSHVWHFKCIRRMLTGGTYPNFLCPNCRAVADLEAEIDEGEASDGDDGLEAAIQQSLDASVENHQDQDHEMTDAPSGEENAAENSSNPSASDQLQGPSASATTPARMIPIRPGAANGELVPGAAATESLMTPRNDAGPFVLDGGAGRRGGAGS